MLIISKIFWVVKPGLYTRTIISYRLRMFNSYAIFHTKNTTWHLNILLQRQDLVCNELLCLPQNKFAHIAGCCCADNLTWFLILISHWIYYLPRLDVGKFSAFHHSGKKPHSKHSTNFIRIRKGRTKGSCSLMIHLDFKQLPAPSVTD